ncbi:MAG: winged helix-turn-helix transcriptional regulator [Ardenticatenales bacterium]|nr:winged helix-turn-helix transcriptional regulator [Ardenticatenales bacterium]
MNQPDLNHAFAALADPARRALVLTLARGPQTAGALAEPFAISRPAISRHLRVLREAGLVAAHTQGRERLYHLAPDRFQEMSHWLSELEMLWDEALLSLKQLVEEAE